MSFITRIRGALTGTKLAEYECEQHGRFDAWVDRAVDPDWWPCPDCGDPSPWCSTALFKPQRGAVTQGKVMDKNHPMALDTRELGDGMPYNEWKKKRAGLWQDHDRKDPKRKEMAERVEKVRNARGDDPA